jgi:hypothetical protein
MTLENGKCDRCGKSNISLSGSWLNTDMLCLECAIKEPEHPRWQEAKDKELEEVKKGNYNYPGLLDGEPLGEW